MKKNKLDEYEEDSREKAACRLARSRHRAKGEKRKGKPKTASPFLVIRRLRGGASPGPRERPHGTNGHGCLSGCSLSHSRNASFIRVCHPLPVALKAAKTSRSNRIVCDAFALPGGRPRRITCSPCIRSAFSNQLSVNSGASSRSPNVFFVTPDFAVIGIPHGNYPAGLLPWCPDDYYNPLAEHSDSYP